MSKDSSDTDREVAEKVMGWTFKQDRGWYKCEGRIRLVEEWSPSTRIDHAWEAVEKMHEGGSYLMLDYDEQRELWLVSFERRAELIADATAKTAPLAICRAALEAVKPQ